MRRSTQPANRYSYRQPVPVSEFRPKGRTERLGTREGEINASSDRDLMSQIGTMIQAAQGGQIMRDTEITAAEEKRMVAAERRLVLDEALADKSGEKWLALGETISDEIYEALGREGFTRKVLGFKPIKRGDIGRIAVRRKDVIAYFIAGGDHPTVVANLVRQNYIHPQDAYLLARILIDDLELELADTDLLEHKYNDGLEQILRQEDLRTKALFDASANTFNDLVFFNAFTPSVFQSMRTQIARWTIPVAHALISVNQKMAA